MLCQMAGTGTFTSREKLKAEGVRAGVADLCLPAARRGYHGLYIEMKSEEGVATKSKEPFFATCWKRAIAR
jgi:hypothetical protein